MRKLKTTLLSITLAIVMIVCSACMKTDIQVKIQEDSTASLKMETSISKSDEETLKTGIYNSLLKQFPTAVADQYINDIFGEIEDFDIINVDGKEYYHYVNEKSFTDTDAMENYLKEELATANVSIGTDHFYAALPIGDISKSGTGITNEDIGELTKELQENGLSLIQLLQMMDETVTEFTVQFPQNITYSNGVYEPDSNTVTWTMKATELMENMDEVKTFYADTMDPSIIKNDTKSPTISGVKNNKYYKKITINTSDNVGLAAVILDGTPVASQITSNDLSAEGEHIIKAIDFTGNSTTINFVYDETKPTIKGVINKKAYTSARTIKFSDKYGIKSAKLNGKTIKTNKKISKNGTYTLKVTDNAGNITTVKFKIKK